MARDPLKALDELEGALLAASSSVSDARPGLAQTGTIAPAHLTRIHEAHGAYLTAIARFEREITLPKARAA